MLMLKLSEMVRARLVALYPLMPNRMKVDRDEHGAFIMSIW